ncbi:hypothetical protein LJB78_00970 [Bacteroidales bacterium OttesenSCG-928-J16]|nr:hypothetical protein [Bacteroidales bacterium OttesenSCG-928-J16]
MKEPDGKIENEYDETISINFSSGNISRTIVFPRRTWMDKTKSNQQS